ncbi:MAG: tetratricopeptide repeat protein, partial [Minwuia sp.]|nr:tetratricopeptide repeat protein [Minwuia sp.]
MNQELGQAGTGNIAVQVNGDGNSINFACPYLVLTRFQNQRLSAAERSKVPETEFLGARGRGTKLVGREAEIAEHKSWLTNGDAISVRVLTGSAGRGKSRFGLELCDLAAKMGWHAGFATAKELSRFRDQKNLSDWGWNRPVLVVVDYAAGLSGELHGWLAELAQNDILTDAEAAAARPLRIFLLERTADPAIGWLQAVRGLGGGDRDAIERLFERAEPHVLPPLADMEDRRQVLSSLLETRGSTLSLPEPGEDDWFDRRLAELSWGGEPLFLMLAASLALREGFAAVLALGRDDLALRIADNELERISNGMAATGAPDRFCHHMAAVATLCGGLGRDQAIALSESEAEATHHTLSRGAAPFIESLLDLHGDDQGNLLPIEPDMIGEALLLKVWPGRCGPNGALVVSRLAANESRRGAVVRTVIRACQDYAIHGHLEPLAWLDELGTAAAADLPVLLQLLNELPKQTLELRERAFSLTETAVDLLRPLAGTEQIGHVANYATALLRLSGRFYDLGCREEALEAIQESVEIWRALTDSRPDSFCPELAGSLNNLSVCLDGLGRREEALAASEEAVKIRRDLAAAHPDAFCPELAGSLNNLSNRLGGLGRKEEALAASEEAVALYRDLAADRPDAFRPDLAGCLNNLSGCLVGLGRREKALAASEEAVEICRELAAAEPDAFRPNLAQYLSNLSSRSIIFGRQEETIAAIEESVEIWRGLAAARPDAFRSDLARSLNNLSNNLRMLACPEEALAASEESVVIWRALADTRPEAFHPNLAGSLINLSGCLQDIGHPEKALLAIEESVEIWRDLAAARPDAFLPDLAMSLNNLSNSLSSLGRQEEALA